MQEPLNDPPAPKTRGERQALKHKAALDGFDLKSKSQIRMGLVTERKCTDILCLFIFAASFVTMIGLTFYGLSKGNVLKLIGPVDGDHNICGVDTFSEFKHLYISNLDAGVSGDFTDIFKTGICVKECPAKVGDPIECMTTSQVSNCNSASLVASEYETVDVAGYCFPKDLEQLPQAYKQGWENVVAQFKSS